MTVFNDTQKLNILKDLIAINTVNDNEKEVAVYIQNLLANYGINSKLTNINGNRSNLIAEIGHGHPVLDLTGHMDVVDPGNIEDWNTDPFKMTEKNGTLYGRGVCDMKSGLAAMVIAMIELHEQGLPKQGTIRLLATMSEEIGEEGSKALLDDGVMNDVDGLIVGEPAGYNISYAEKGSMDIKITSKGKTSHSSMSEFGYNAIDALMNFLTEANNTLRNSTAKHDTMGKLVFNTTTITGGSQVNSIPNIACADVNVRTTPEYNNQQVITDLNKIMQKWNNNGAQISMDIYMNEQPVSSKKDNVLVELAKETLKPYTDGQVTYLNDMSQNIQETMQKYQTGNIFVFANPGITDASNLVQGKSADFPFIVAGPGNLTSHKINEELNKQMYLDYTNIYQKLTIKFLEKVTNEIPTI